MKILLLSVNSQSFFYRQVVIPFGLASLGSYVSARGYTLKGIDMNTPHQKIIERYLRVDRELLTEITEYAPDLVAMSTYAENIFNVLFWAEIIKQALPETLITIGGNHVSYMAEEALKKCPAVDFVVRFEGEIPFARLCEKISKNDRDYTDIPNLSYRHQGQVIENEITGLIQDLDSLPSLNPEFFERRDKEQIIHADIISARGCPFHCTFCDCNHYWRKKYRTWSVERVIQNLHDLKERYPNLKTVRFRDESLTIQKPRALKLCERIIEEGFQLEFQAHSRLDGLDEELIRKLSEAGFRQLFIGVESGSEAVLERLQKGITLNNIYSVVPLLRKYAIRFRLSLMLATPYELLEESLKTVNLVNELDLAFDEFYFGTGIIIYPGTQNCTDFLQQHPDFQWLSDQELSEGFHKQCDRAGNTVGIFHLQPHYTMPELYRAVNACLHPRLLPHGEIDYFHFRSVEGIALNRNHRFESDEKFQSIIQRIIRGMEQAGKPWAIVGNTTYYTYIFQDVLERLHHELPRYRGFLPITNKRNPDERASLLKTLRKLPLIVLAFPKEEARSKYVKYCLNKLQYTGTIILVDAVLQDGNALEALTEHGVTAIPNDMMVRQSTKTILRKKLGRVKGRIQHFLEK